MSETLKVTPPAARALAPAESTTGWLLDQLPMCFATDNFLRRFVGIFQELADGMRGRINGVEHSFDATVAPPQFVRWMGGWLGIRGIDPSLPADRQRDLVFGFGELLVHRGTRAGLQRAVELVTGEQAIVRDPGAVLREGDPRPPLERVRISVASTGGMSVSELGAVIRDWLPAAATAELWVGGQRVWDETGRGAQ